ncbi:hypothetical protein PHJA_001708400 [Phtheirospermum japonicum]|uniref:Uncharacterized protein n=1 Tax=Phtheirospermum japonicum TaxID=374723 RepID=A0A830CBI1_9LAMI|nr:hypothetical protein PHJA_001708400 [Phtheirospermum japonicum]
MKETVFMKVLLCKKLQFPFMCFCKPSAAHICNSAPLKLENSPHIVPSTAYAVSESSDESSSGAEEENKSCIKKLDSTRPVSVRMKRVQWRDNKIGKQLFEIKEFESSETEDTDNEDESSRCLCVIL